MLSRGSCGIAAVSLLLLAGSAHAQARKPVKRATPRTAVKSAPKPSPSKRLVDAVWANVFLGDGTLYQQCGKQLWPALLWGLDGVFNNNELVKGEFETSDAFEDRKTKLEDAVAGPEGGALVVCVPFGGDSANLTYNADTETYHATLEPDALVEYYEKKTGAYRSKTAMGVAATVTAYLSVEYRVDMSPYITKTDSCLQVGYSAASFDFPMSRALAPGLKADGYVALVGRLRAPFLNHQESSGNPTLSDPTDYSSLTLKARFKPKEMKVVGPAGIAFQCTFSPIVASTTPTPRSPMSSWVTADDYPAAALRARQQGTTVFRLDIDATGRVTNCTVVGSSGSAILDSTTCSIMQRRARFNPARDAQDRLTPTSITSRFTWTLPQ